MKKRNLNHNLCMFMKDSTSQNVCAYISWYLQQVSICHQGGSHIQGMSVVCGGLHKQTNSQDLDTSLDLFWCMSSQTATNRQMYKFLSINSFYHSHSCDFSVFSFDFFSVYSVLTNLVLAFLSWVESVGAYHFIRRSSTSFCTGSYRDHHYWAHRADTCQRLGLQQVLKWNEEKNVSLH